MIAGSHGKTTTTGMLVWALREVGFSFSTWLREIRRRPPPRDHVIQAKNHPGDFGT